MIAHSQPRCKEPRRKLVERAKRRRDGVGGRTEFGASMSKGETLAALAERRGVAGQSHQGNRFGFLPRTKSQQKSRQAQQSIVWTDISAPTRSQTAKCDCPAKPTHSSCMRERSLIT